MNRLLQDEDETRDYDRMDTRRGQGQGQDREISLGTTMLLGIFFAIALLCAVFFGFGYSLGARHAAPAAAAAPPADSTPSAFSGFKPSPFGQGSAKSSSSAETAPPPTVTVKTPPAAKAVVQDADNAPAPKPAPIVRQAPPAAAAPVPMPPVVAASPTTSVVQVAAVSHQEDADLLISTLKRRGYAVAIRQEPQDHLLHVQIGPFANRKDADAMRQRLLNDGFNAIVK